MTNKDYFEICYWLVSLLILLATVYYIYTSPIKAVKIGRELDNKQNKHKAKLDLFLQLFSLRGNPTNYSFVNGLNQIEIVFEDSSEVLEAWRNLYEALHHQDQKDNWDLLRTNLLSVMAQELNYKSKISNSYVPKAHIVAEDDYYNQNQAAKTFFETGIELNRMLIASHSSQNTDTTEQSAS